MVPSLPILCCVISAVTAATGDTNDGIGCDHDCEFLSLMQSPQTLHQATIAWNTGAEHRPTLAATVAKPAPGIPKQAMAQQTQKFNLVSGHATRATSAGTWMLPLGIALCMVAILMCLLVARRGSAESGTHAMPSHLSTERGRWKSFLIVVIANGFVSGPTFAWQTLEPIFIHEGVFAGPDQKSTLTIVCAIAASMAVIATLPSGIFYDSVGPRATAAVGAFGAVVCLVGMAIGVQFQSLNFLIWFCYPGTVAFGMANLLGGYAWLYLLPDSQGIVAALTCSMFLFTDTTALIAVFLHNEIGMPLPCYFAFCSFLASVAGMLCYMLIPEHSILQEVAAVVANTTVDEQIRPDSAADSSVRIKDETFRDAVKRSCARLRDSGTCLSRKYPGASFVFLCYMCSTYMVVMYPSFVLYPFLQAFLGTATATTLVNIYSLAGIGNLIGSALTGLFLDYAGFKATITSLSVLTILNFAVFCIPNFVTQVLGQALNSWINGALPVFGVRWCLCYTPSELYGSTFGIIMAVIGISQMIGMFLGTLVSNLIDKLVTDSPPPAMPYLTTMGMWSSLSIISCLAYLFFLRFYPMPASGGTSMADIASCRRGTNEDAVRM